MKYLFSLVFLIFSILSASSQHVIQGKVKGFDGKRVYLLKFKADQQEIIDSTASLDGVFSFSLPSGTKPGVYRLILGEMGRSNFFNEDPQYFDLIFNNEDISLTTSYLYPIDSMVVSRSKENDIYYRFLRSDAAYQLKLAHISPLFSIYKPGDDFYNPLKSEFLTVQRNFSEEAMKLSAELPGSIVSSIIGMSLLPQIENPYPASAMKDFIRDHYFDLITFSDERLLNSPVITKAILDYLSLFREPKADQSEQEIQYIEAVDHLMTAATGKPAIYDFVLNFLVDGFQHFQMEKVLVYIAENYIEGGCETDSKALLKKRLDGYEKMAPGKKVPDILNLDQDGKQIRLYDIDRDYTLVVFWASWCPHCSSFLQQLSKWYPDRKIDLEVFAVSIDSSRFAWEENLMMQNYPWINTFSGAGWEGKAPKDYNVYATPTLFLIDRDHKILAKPLTFKEFKREVDKLETKGN
ncbi:MAG: redoxin domain-containing protein [Bacteroidales bacterium]|nr:redoxin domain-containing protein [Bacteroidales bacterium]MCB8999374.1 redoxin domain-containing protein [Bacteroidales bacterium]MCB9013383.1 redoxin domain-containing protein [Bacteroidales bacterium]